MSKTFYVRSEHARRGIAGNCERLFTLSSAIDALLPTFDRGDYFLTPPLLQTPLLETAMVSLSLGAVIKTGNTAYHLRSSSNTCKPLNFGALLHPKSFHRWAHATDRAFYLKLLSIHPCYRTMHFCDKFQPKIFVIKCICSPHTVRHGFWRGRAGLRYIALIIRKISADFVFLSKTRWITPAHKAEESF